MNTRLFQQPTTTRMASSVVVKQIASFTVLQSPQVVTRVAESGHVSQSQTNDCHLF